MNSPFIKPLSVGDVAVSHTFAQSRASLTAASQIHNLYFVAAEDLIRVYRPSFPDQLLQYVGFIDPPKARNRRGFIDPRSPHSINNIIVAWLGIREILLIATDCGDVCSWWTDHIDHATSLTKSSEDSSSQDEERSHVLDIKPWMYFNVKASAWGLAVHQQARKIAVSCNSHQVCTFEFALFHDDPEVKLKRYREKLIWTPRSGNNIPSVAFCNTGHDPTGRYLLSGDIDGRVILWDLESGTSVDKWTAHYCPLRGGDSCKCFGSQLDFPHAVWGLFWLDPRCFPAPPRARKLSKSSHHIDVPLNDRPEWKLWYISEPPPKVNTTAGASGPLGFRVIPYQEIRYDLSFSAGVDYSSSEDDSDIEDFGPPIRRGHLSGKRFVVSHQTGEGKMPESLPLMLLQISAEQVFLNPERCPSELTSDITVAMPYPLHQDIVADKDYEQFFNQSYLRRSTWQHRITMHAIILELGLVMIAAPAGRCAVLSLHQDVAPDGKNLYSMTLDQILPLHEQEYKRERPAEILMGIAVAPMQGEWKSTADRAWRLLLYYENDRVLSYEVRRGLIGASRILDIV
jgi:CRT10